MIRISHAGYSSIFVLIHRYVYCVLRTTSTFLLLGVLRMLLGQLRSQGGNLGLQRRHLVFVLLFHSCHASFDVTHVLPHIDALVAHDLARAGTAAGTVAGNAAGLRRRPRGWHLLLQHAGAVGFSALRALLGDHVGGQAWESWQMWRAVGLWWCHAHGRRTTARTGAPGETGMHARRSRHAALWDTQSMLLLTRREGLWAFCHSTVAKHVGLVRCVVERGKAPWS